MNNTEYNYGNTSDALESIKRGEMVKGQTTIQEPLTIDEPNKESIHKIKPIKNSLYDLTYRMLKDLPYISKQDIPWEYHKVLFHTETVLYHQAPNAIASCYDNYPEAGVLQYMFGADGMPNMHRTFVTVYKREVVIGVIPREKNSNIIDYSKNAIYTYKDIARDNTLTFIERIYYDKHIINNTDDYRSLTAGVYEYFRRVFKDFNRLTPEQKYYIKSDLAGSLFTQGNKFTHQTFIDFCLIFAYKYGLNPDCNKPLLLYAKDISQDSINQAMEF